MFCVDCCLTQLSLCSLLTMLLFLLLPCFSAQHTLLLTRYANFVYLGFRRSLAYLHLSAASPPSSVAIGGNCVCVLSSLECNLYRLLVASLTAGLNIIPITENSPWCLVKAREGTSPVTIVTSVPWERERDITEVAVLAARPAKQRSVSDSDVIVACTAFYTASQLVSICMRCAYFATIGQSFDWREPIGLQERLEGRSSHNGEFSVMSRSRSQGTEVTIVTGDVFWSTPEPMWLYLTPQHDGFLCNAICGLEGRAHSTAVSYLALHVLWFLWIPWIVSHCYVWYLVKDLNSLQFCIAKCDFWFVWHFSCEIWHSDEPWSSFACKDWDAPFILKHDTLTYYQFTCLLWTVSKQFNVDIL